ncbi:hypothetical protein [Dapis sp. BLCC M172]
MSVLEIGAGNGLIGEKLRQLDVPHLVGQDISQIACDAAMRDQPKIYDKYIVGDLSDSNGEVFSKLKDTSSINCLIAVGSLGFSDISTKGFSNALNIVEPGGLLAISIKEEFLLSDNQTGFGKFIDSLISENFLEKICEIRYVHRLATSGKPIFYIVLCCRKLR